MRDHCDATRVDPRREFLGEHRAVNDVPVCASNPLFLRAVLPALQDDCARVSHLLSATLDVSDLIAVTYNLEVSSPGLDRPLRKEADFQRFVGKKAKIRTRRPIGDQRRNFSGKLVAVEAGKVRIDVGDQVCEVPIAEVEKAHLVFEFEKNAR